MRSHADADAFMRASLRQPEDVTARLVFADWLDETGGEHNAAWARFIRLKIEAAQHAPGSCERLALDRGAEVQAPLIRAKLTIPAQLFVDHPEELLQLLPAPNITVRLKEFEVPQQVLELLPESVARENDVITLDLRGRTLFIAGNDRRNLDTVQKLEFILNCKVILVQVELEDVQEAINRAFGWHATESVDSVLVEFVDTAGPFYHPAPDNWSTESDAPIVRLVNLIFTEATNMRADRILLYPDLGSVGVRYRIDNEWMERDQAPIRLLRPLVARIAIMAQIDFGRAFGPGSEPLTGEVPLTIQNDRFRLGVTILPSPDGPTTQINISREPAT
jgi:uncharacterized protein (TIGR02996 family)